ncbi:hypothetical protein [Brevundimonas sp. TWP2-3-4b2]|uniref:hypothetical protein n=1 Tax=Brevundimonas sp. TWP2-3-4b2 TaxID=2804595 RepID=UPI003CEFB5AB
MTGIVIVLLVAFTLPAWIGLIALISGQWRGDTGLGRFFFLTLFHPSPVWDLVRTGLAATIAAIAAMNVADKWDVRTGVVVIAVLAMFAPLAVMFLYLLDPRHGMEIWQVVDQGEAKSPIESVEAFDRVWNAFLAGQMQVLAAHLALFLGLRSRTMP